MATLESKIDEAKNKRALLIARQQRAKAEKAIHETMAGISNSNTLNAFDRIQDRVLDAEVDAEALREMSQLQKNLADEIEALNRTDELDDELAKLKARLSE